MPDILIRLDKMQPIENNHGIKAELRRIDGKLELGIRNDGDSHCEHWIWYLVEELPPHWDLIDVGKAKEAKFKLDDDFPNDYRIGWNDAIDSLTENAPVIVPAERREEDG